MPQTPGGRKARFDSRHTARRKAAETKRAETIAAAMMGEAQADEAQARQADEAQEPADWLAKAETPSGLSGQAKPYWERLRAEWQGKGLEPLDCPLLHCLAISLAAADYHDELAADSDRKDWPQHARARDRATANAERLHKRLVAAAELGLASGDGEPQRIGPNIVVGKFRQA